MHTATQTAAAATKTVEALATTGAEFATAPVRGATKAFSRDLAGATTTRRCWRGDDRAWIEVRGLNGPGGHELGAAVLAALGAHCGVTSATLNHPLSRAVVGIDETQTSLRQVCRVIAEAEGRPRPADDGETGKPPGAPHLPGDGLTTAVEAIMFSANAAGLGVAVLGRALRWPALPPSVAAAVSAVRHQPPLRRIVEERLGTSATDTVLSLAMTAAHTVNLSPTSLTVDAMMETLKIAESRAEARAWRRREPQLAGHVTDSAAGTGPWPPPAPEPTGPVERHMERVAWLQAFAAAAVGAATRSVNSASNAALVTAPKAARTTRESFAATLGRGLADRHAALPLRPRALRMLDRVEVVVVDPRVLCDDKLRVVRVRGADERELAAAWDRAQARLADADLTSGWHRLGPDDGSGAEALVQPTHHPLASAVVGEAHRAGVEVGSVDVDALGELRPEFDELSPLTGGSVDAALAAAVAGYQRQGRSVAVVSSSGPQALSAADVALAVAADDAPPWQADVWVSDLAGAWRVLHALPAARAASRRGVEIASGASALGALLLLPGVAGRGPGPVSTGAAAGAVCGYWLARRAVNAAAPRPAPVNEWHAMSVSQVLDVLPPPDPEPGDQPRATSAAGAALALARRGVALAATPREATWQFVTAVRAELADPMTPVLALGAAASAVLGSPVDAVLVGSVLSANAVLAAAQRLGAERRLAALLTGQVPPARRVTATENYVDVVAEQLRPGDVIEVRSHEVVPADGRLIAVADLEVDESSLTGESLSVVKQVEATPGADLADRACMLFAGTTVVAGTATAVVTAAGGDTYANRATELVTSEAQSVGLQHQLSLLTRQAWRVSLGGGALVAALGMVRRAGLRQAVASGVAVSVAAIPEGLPLVATLAQQASARRLTNSGALVRVPRSVEALGRVDVVCFDKTGTLSQNRLRVARVHPVGDHTRDEVLRAAARAAPDANGGPQIHATDTAITEAAAAVNGTDASTETAAHLPFRSGRPLSASVTGTEVTVKGAPEAVLAGCGHGDAAPSRSVSQLAADGLRVIAVAHRTLTAEQALALGTDPEPEAIAAFCGDGLSLAGLLGISDTPRDEAAGLLAELDGRQLPTRLLTGDHPITAAAIARELGMPVGDAQVIGGAEWEALSRRDQERAVAERVVFARMSPEHKVQIVQTLERTGRVCAMVGDGANDAAAIRAATVGIGVVGHGSDPARTAADVVLLDGRIEALTDALDEGRQLWRRVQAAVSVLLGGNAGEVGFALIGTAITGNSPLNTRQLLLVNMLTDALPATALAVSPPTGSAPTGGHGPDPAALWRTVAVRGVATTGAAATAWALGSVTGRPQRAATVALVALVAAQLGQTLLDSHDRLVVATAVGSLAAMGTLISVPGVSQLLGCTPLGPIGWSQALGSATAATVAAGLLSRALAARAPDAARQPGGEIDSTDDPGGDDPGDAAGGDAPGGDAAVASVVDIRSAPTAESGSATNPSFPKGD